MKPTLRSLLCWVIVFQGPGFPGPAAAAPAAAAAAAAAPAAADSGEWKSLFDGKSLRGWWKPFDWGQAVAADGEIRLTSDKKFFLLTEDTYRDFVFEAEIMLPEGKSNSGFMFRAHQEPNRVWGYQAEVDPSERAWSGGLYDEGRRGWLHPVKGDEDSVGAFTGKGDALKRDDWNRYRITCRGDRIAIEVNGTVTTEYRDGMDAGGYIGLQHHGEDGQTYRFRKIRIQDLSPAAGEWKNLFAGGGLEQWTTASGAPVEPGGWVMEEGGVLHRAGKGDQLYSREEFENFELEFEWKVAKGANSGVKYRVAKYGEKGQLLGAEYQVLDDEGHANGEKPKTSAGSLYDVAAPSADKELKPVGEWNRTRIVAEGTRLRHDLNGAKVLEVDTASRQWKKMIEESKFRGIEDFATKKGRLLIQDHGDEVWFRGMRVREL